MSRIGSKEYIDDHLRIAHDVALSAPTHRIIKSTSFFYFWNYDYISDAKKVAIALRRRGYSATVVPEVRNKHVVYEVYYRDWEMGKNAPKPDWRKRNGGIVAPPRKRKKS